MDIAAKQVYSSPDMDTDLNVSLMSKKEVTVARKNSLRSLEEETLRRTRLQMNPCPSGLRYDCVNIILSQNYTLQSQTVLSVLKRSSAWASGSFWISFEL